MVVALAVVVTVGCSSSKRSSSQSALAAGSAGTAATANSARECLPVVAAKCGCKYTCGLGVRQADGSYLVSHTFWKNKKLKARIDTWCVAGACTRAFYAEIVCGGICARRPADPTCHFEGGHCVGERSPSL